MELRRATSEDWRACREVRLRALAQDPSVFCSTLERESNFDEHVWKQRLVDGFTVLAWNDPIPVATVTGTTDPHEAGGREMVAMWIDSHEFALWVAEDNERARHLYERNGFTATGERDVMRPGTDQIRMRMSLTDDTEGAPPASALR